MHDQSIIQSSNRSIDENWFSEPHLKRLYQKLTESVNLPILDIINSLPDSARPLAESIYLDELTIDLSKVESQRQSLKVIFELEEAYLKDRLIKINVELASTLDPAHQIRLKQEKDLHSSRLKEIEDGRMVER